MRFNDHRNLEGQHAFLSPSKYYWIDYDIDRLVESYYKAQAVSEGIELHDFARRCIERGVKLPRKKKTLNLYVNDAIRYGLTPEQPLYYSANCFGTADAIGFDEATHTLRIFDLKTGTSRTSNKQLMIYAALFFLEYPEVDIRDTTIILRIYKCDEIEETCPTANDIYRIMETIEEYSALVDSLENK